MDTTIADMAKFAAALVRGDGLSAASRAELAKPQLHIGVAHQFPLFLQDLPANEQRKDLAAGSRLPAGGRPKQDRATVSPKGA